MKLYREVKALLKEMREVNWRQEASRLFDRLSNSVHIYLTLSLVLGSVVMWFTGVRTGLFVVTLMTVPVAVIKLSMSLATGKANDRHVEEHFASLMEGCTRSATSYRETWPAR